MAIRKGKSVENHTHAFVAPKIAVECCIKKVRQTFIYKTNKMAVDHIRLGNDGDADTKI